jgi:hypothetical protein
MMQYYYWFIIFVYDVKVGASIYFSLWTIFYGKIKEDQIYMVYNVYASFNNGVMKSTAYKYNFNFNKNTKVNDAYFSHDWFSESKFEE